MSPPAGAPEPRTPGYAAGLACGLVVPVVWGGWIVASRFGVTHALTAWDVAALRVGVGALLVLPLVLARGFSGLPLWKAAVISAGAGAPFALTSFGGMALAPVVHAGVLTNGTMPIFAAILGFVWLGLRQTRLQLAGMAAILVGGGLIGAESFSVAAPAGQWLGDLLLVASAACFALYLTALRAWQVTVPQALASVTTISAALYVPIWALFLPSGLLRGTAPAPWEEVALQAVYQGLVASVIVVVLLTRASRALGATTIAVFLSGAPAIAVLFGLAFLGETPSAAAWAGLAVTTAGMVLAVGRR